MEEAATQEGRAKQLEDEIKELRSKNKRVLQEEMMKTELLEKVMFVNISSPWEQIFIVHLIVLHVLA